MAEFFNVLRRYGPGGTESILEQLRTNKHVIKFAIRETRDVRTFAAGLDAYRASLVRQDALFTRQRVDDITDAMRHANASALVVDRIRRVGTPLDVAAGFMRRLGQAHEADSTLTGAHRAASEAMDLHNNELGIAIALRHANATSATDVLAGEQALEGAVLRALAAGEGLVLDTPTSLPRASTIDELRAVLRDPGVLR